MLNRIVEMRVVVRPVNGMQLSEGYIRKDRVTGYLGLLLGFTSFVGRTLEEVKTCLETKAREYYGSDILVEFMPLESS